MYGAIWGGMRLWCFGIGWVDFVSLGGMVLEEILTDKEIEVVVLASEGLTLREIAIKMGKSPRTIDGYRDRILKALKARNMTHAVGLLFRTGVIG